MKNCLLLIQVATKPGLYVAYYDIGVFGDKTDNSDWIHCTVLYRNDSGNYNVI